MCEQLLNSLEETFERLPGSKSKMGLAGRMGCSVDTIYKVLQGKRRNDDLIDFVIELVNYSGDLAPLQYIAAKCNAIVIPLEPHTTKDKNQILRSVKEVSDYSGSVAESMIDRKLNKEEAKKLLKEANEAFEQLGAAIQHLNGVIKNG